MAQLLKLVPGLAMLGIALAALMNGYAWPWGWAIGVVLLVIGILSLGKSEENDSF